MEITAQNAIYLGEETGGKGRQFKARFLVPGLVKYDYGVCLLTKENADKFIQGFTGCPVIINHQTVTDKNVKDIAVGDIFSVWFDEKDGYYWCNGILRDKEAIKLINEGYSVSCQYLITEYSDNTTGALHNGNPYDKVIENGKPEHLAIVNNPRYEGAIIAVNALLAENEQWITIKPNGEENKGRHLLLRDGESPAEAVRRVYGDKNQKTLFDTKEYKKTKEDFKKEAEEKEKQIKDFEKSAKKRQENLEHLGTDDPDNLEDLSGEDITFEEWEEKRTKSIIDGIKKDFEGKEIPQKVKDDFKKTYGIDFPEQKQSDKEDKKEETKVYTEDTYDEFHKKFYKDYGDKWYINQLKDGFYVDKMKNGIGKSKTIKNNEIDEYLKDDVVRLRLNNKKKTSKDGNTNFVEDTKSLQKFLDSGYIVSDKYNDGYKMNYILQKSQLKGETEQIKNNETSKDFVKRILETKIEKYKPTSYTIDWGSLRSQKQGKRSNGMITGSMGDMTLQGGKEYKKILGGLPEYEEIKDEFNGGGLESEQMKVAYLKAREAGFNKEESLDFAYTIFEPDNALYKKLKKQTASNSFVSQFKDTLYTVLAEGIYNRLGE